MKKFIRSKSLCFFNNKWGVGKTTIAYNTAVKFAEHGYKTVLVDLDPQCNLSKLTLWDTFGESLFNGRDDNVYGMLKGILKWGADVDLEIPHAQISENLQILPGSIHLTQYENLLITAYNQAAAGQEIWYFQTSAISRYLKQYSMEYDVDLFILDLSPSLGLLNRVILLGSDYFVAPLMPDAFSVQWVENLWVTLQERKENRKNTWRAMWGQIVADNILSGEWLFLGYIINSYNQYNQKPIHAHKDWMKKIPWVVDKYISQHHCKNGLVNKSSEKSLVDLKDYWELAADSHRANKAIFNLDPGIDFNDVEWTKDNWDLANSQFEELFNNLCAILHKY